MVLIERKAIRRRDMAVPAIFCFFCLWGIKILSCTNAVEKEILCVRRQTNNEPLTNYPQGVARRIEIFRIRNFPKVKEYNTHMNYIYTLYKE